MRSFVWSAAVVTALIVDAPGALAQLVQSEIEEQPTPDETSQLVTSSTEVRRAVVGLIAIAVLVALLGILYWRKTGQEARERHRRRFGGVHRDGTEDAAPVDAAPVAAGVAAANTTADRALNQAGNRVATGAHMPGGASSEPAPHLRPVAPAPAPGAMASYGAWTATAPGVDPATAVPSGPAAGALMSSGTGAGEALPHLPPPPAGYALGGHSPAGYSPGGYAPAGYSPGGYPAGGHAQSGGTHPRSSTPESAAASYTSAAGHASYGAAPERPNNSVFDLGPSAPQSPPRPQPREAPRPPQGGEGSHNGASAAHGPPVSRTVGHGGNVPNGAAPLGQVDGASGNGAAAALPGIHPTPGAGRRPPKIAPRSLAGDRPGPSQSPREPQPGHRPSRPTTAAAPYPDADRAESVAPGHESRWSIFRKDIFG